MPKTDWPVCMICGQTVSTKEGGLTLYSEELEAFQEAESAWEKAHPSKVEGLGTIIDVSGISAFPDLVRWNYGHSNCIPQGMYWIDYSRFDTVSKALDWTLHLMEKNWISSTNWDETVRLHHKLTDA